jgi:hypothetical protein
MRCNGETERKQDEQVINRRPICPTCNQRYCSVNHINEGVRHYRSQCDCCQRSKANLKPRKPKWPRSRYKKKAACDLCGFHAVFPSQLTVFYVDGNLNNTDLVNLRTICLCCIEIVKVRNVTWKRGDLVVD